MRLLLLIKTCDRHVQSDQGFVEAMSVAKSNALSITVSYYVLNSIGKRSAARPGSAHRLGSRDDESRSEKAVLSVGLNRSGAAKKGGCQQCAAWVSRDSCVNRRCGSRRLELNRGPCWLEVCKVQGEAQRARERQREGLGPRTRGQL